MAVQYTCRSCRHVLAEFATMTPELQNSLDLLTPEERMQMITEDEFGNVTVHVLCDYCQEAIMHNPELSLLTSPLQ